MIFNLILTNYEQFDSSVVPNHQLINILYLFIINIALFISFYLIFILFFIIFYLYFRLLLL